jgi:hypothetical protein
MKKFIFLYKGFVTPTPEIGRAWMEWFSGVGDRMADSGNPMTRGVEVTPNGVVPLEVGIESLTGYSIVKGLLRFVLAAGRCGSGGFARPRIDHGEGLSAGGSGSGVFDAAGYA